MAGPLTRLERTVFLWKHRTGVRRGLALLSLGLGAAQLARREPWAFIAGLPRGRHSQRTVRARGLRELMAGVALLAGPGRGTSWLRLAGQVLDLGQIVGARPPARRRGSLVGSLLGTLGMAALEALARQEPAEGAHAPVEVAASVVIERTPGEVFRFWRRARNLPRFVAAIASARHLDARHDRWQPRDGGPAWDVEIVEEEAGRLLAWRARRAGSVACAGAVSFTAGADGHGTVVHVALHHRGGAGDTGRALRQFFGDAPEARLSEDLTRLKQLLETEAPSGRRPRRTKPRVRPVRVAAPGAPRARGE